MRPLPHVGVWLSACGLLGLLLCSAAQAEDQEFSMLVKEIETRYHVKRTHIPLFGFMKPMIKMSGPAGAKTLELAVFEDQDFYGSGHSDVEFDSKVQQILSSAWQPIVRVHSRKDGERVDIYIRTAGKDLRVMFLTRERNEAVLLQAKLDPNKLGEWLENPERIEMTTETEASGEQDE